MLHLTSFSIILRRIFMNMQQTLQNKHFIGREKIVYSSYQYINVNALVVYHVGEHEMSDPYLSTQ